MVKKTSGIWEFVARKDTLCSFKKSSHICKNFDIATNDHFIYFYLNLITYYNNYTL